MTTEQSPLVMAWWTALIVVSLINVGAWAVVARQVERLRQQGDTESYRVARQQLLLSALFVLGCGFRSLLPRAEAQRICLVDSWLSSAMIGRSVATVAELALIAQFATIIRALGVQARSVPVAALSSVLLPAIAFAELCSWYTALTTNFVGSVIEESTWALTAALMTAALFILRTRSQGVQRRFIVKGIAIGLAYVAFMCLVDIPMYWARWRADEARDQRYLSLTEAWPDALNRRVVTRSWSDWRQEIPWMSLYFTAGVWVSIALVRTSFLTRKLEGQDPGPRSI